MSQIIGKGRYATDVYPKSRIQISGLPAGSDGQVLTTAGGIATWATVVDANVASGAAIAGVKITPDFGSQQVNTTNGYVSNSSTPYIRLGLAPGSGVGVASAAAMGAIRLARGGGNVASIFGRNNTDTADTLLFDWNSVGEILQIGTSAGISSLRFQCAIGGTTIFQIGAASMLSVSLATVLISTVNMLFSSSVVAPIFGQADDNTVGATADKLIVRAQRVTNGGVTTGGPLEVAAGDSIGAATTGTGGDADFRSGDVQNATVSNIGGNSLYRGGRALSAAGAVDGNMAFHARPSSWSSSQRVAFFGNAVARPASAPSLGVFVAGYGGRLLGYGSGGAIQQFASTGPDSTKSYKQHVAPNIGRTTTSGLATATGASYDLSSATEELGSFDNSGLVVFAEFQGYTAAGGYCCLIRRASFKRVAGVASQVGSTEILGTDVADAALAGVAATIDVSGTTVRARPTGVVGQDITWTVRIWLSGSES